MGTYLPILLATLCVCDAFFTANLHDLDYSAGTTLCGLPPTTSGSTRIFTCGTTTHTGWISDLAEYCVTPTSNGWCTDGTITTPGDPALKYNSVNGTFQVGSTLYGLSPHVYIATIPLSIPDDGVERSWYALGLALGANQSVDYPASYFTYFIRFSEDFDGYVAASSLDLTKDTYVVNYTGGIPATLNTSAADVILGRFAVLPTVSSYSRRTAYNTFILAGTSVFVDTDDYDDNVLRLVYSATPTVSCTATVSTGPWTSPLFTFTSDGGATDEYFTFTDAMPGAEVGLLTLCCASACDHADVGLDGSTAGCKVGADTYQEFACYYYKYPGASISITLIIIGIVLIILWYMNRAGYLYPLHWGWYQIRRSMAFLSRMIFRYHAKKYMSVIPTKMTWAQKLIVYLATIHAAKALSTPLNGLNVTYAGCTSEQEAHLASQLSVFDTHTSAPYQQGTGDVVLCQYNGSSLAGCTLSMRTVFDLQTVPGSVTSFSLTNLTVPAAATKDGVALSLAVSPVEYGSYYFGLYEDLKPTYLYTMALAYSITWDNWNYCDGDYPPEHGYPFYNWCLNDFCNPKAFNCAMQGYVSYKNQGNCGYFASTLFKLANQAPIPAMTAGGWVNWPPSDYFLSGVLSDECSTCNRMSYTVTNYSEANFAHVYSVDPETTFTHRFATFKKNSTTLAFTCAAAPMGVVTTSRIDRFVSVTTTITESPQPSSIGFASRKIALSRSPISGAGEDLSGYYGVVGPIADRGYGNGQVAGTLQYFGVPTSHTFPIARAPSTSPCSTNAFGDSDCWQNVWDFASFAAQPYRPLTSYFSDIGQGTFTLNSTTVSGSLSVPDCDVNGDAHNTTGSFSYPALTASILRTDANEFQLVVDSNVLLSPLGGDVHPRFQGPPVVNGTVGASEFCDVCVNVTSLSAPGPVVLSILPATDSGSMACFLPLGSYTTCCVTTHLSDTQGRVAVLATTSAGYTIVSAYGAYNVTLDTSVPSFTAYSGEALYVSSGNNGWDLDGLAGAGDGGGWFGFMGGFGDLMKEADPSGVLYTLITTVLIIILPIVVLTIIVKLLVGVINGRAKRD